MMLDALDLPGELRGFDAEARNGLVDGKVDLGNPAVLTTDSKAFLHIISTISGKYPPVRTACEIHWFPERTWLQ